MMGLIVQNCRPLNIRAYLLFNLVVVKVVVGNLSKNFRLLYLLPTFHWHEKKEWE